MDSPSELADWARHLVVSDASVAAWMSRWCDASGPAVGLLFELWADAEWLVALFQSSGRLFTEQDVRGLYRRYYRGERTITEAPEVRHALKVARSRATKQQLETPTDFIDALRRVQDVIWPRVEAALKALHTRRSAQATDGNPLDVALSASVHAQLPLNGTTAVLVSGTLRDVVLWVLAFGSGHDYALWMSLALVYRRHLTSAVYLHLLTECAERGTDALPAWLFQPLARQRATASLVKRGAAKMLWAWKTVYMSRPDVRQAIRLDTLQRVEAVLGAVDASGDEELPMLARHHDASASAAAAVFTIPPPLSREWPGLAGADANTVCTSPHKNFSLISPQQLAQQLTLMDCALILAVSMDDVLHYAGLHGTTKSDGSEFRRIEQRFERFVWVIVTNVCRAESVNAQAGLLQYWIQVEDALERAGNLHGAMAVCTALSHFVVSGSKRAWQAVSQEMSQTHKRVSALFMPTGNYKAYRNRVRELQAALIRQHLLGPSASPAPLLIPAAPVLQRDTAVGMEMATVVDAAIDAINWQKIRVLGEGVTLYHLAQLSCRTALSAAPVDEDVCNYVKLMPWTSDEAVLVADMKRHLGEAATSPRGGRPSPGPAARATVRRAASGLEDAPRSRGAYLPGTESIVSGASELTEDLSTTEESATPSTASSSSAPALIWTRNPLVDMVSGDPLRKARLAVMVSRPKRYTGTGRLRREVLELPMDMSNASFDARVSPRGESPRNVPVLGALKRMLSSGGGPQDSLLDAQTAVRWCESCHSRKALPSDQLCADCASEARPDPSDELLLLIHDGEDRRPRPLHVRKGSTWNAVCYCIECDIGDQVLRKGLVVRHADGTDGMPITNDSDWALACRTATADGTLSLYTSSLPAQLISPRPTASPQKPKLDSRSPRDANRSVLDAFSKRDKTSPRRPVADVFKDSAASADGGSTRSPAGFLPPESPPAAVPASNVSFGSSGSGSSAVAPVPLGAEPKSARGGGAFKSFTLRRPKKDTVRPAVSTTVPAIKVEWCRQCDKQRAQREGNGLCADCAAATPAPDAAEPSLHVCVKMDRAGATRELVVRASISFADLMYVLKCELGDEASTKGFVGRNEGGRPFLVDREVRWKLLVALAKGGTIQLEARDSLENETELVGTRAASSSFDGTIEEGAQLTLMVNMTADHVREVTVSRLWSWPVVVAALDSRIGFGGAYSYRASSDDDVHPLASPTDWLAVTKLPSSCRSIQVYRTVLGRTPRGQ